MMATTTTMTAVDATAEERKLSKPELGEETSGGRRHQQRQKHGNDHHPASSSPSGPKLSSPSSRIISVPEGIAQNAVGEQAEQKGKQLPNDVAIKTTKQPENRDDVITKATSPAAAEDNNNADEHHHHHHSRVNRFFRKIVSKIGHVFGHHHHNYDDPDVAHQQSQARMHNHCQHRRHRISARRLQCKVDVLLHGCSTKQEHWEKVYDCVDESKQLHGANGLKYFGFEYRTIEVPSEGYDTDVNDDDNGKTSESNRLSINENGIPTQRRLFHIETNTLIDVNNRKKFIADGDMYDSIARLCQHAAQDVMIKEGNLKWITVTKPSSASSSNGSRSNDAEPIRALVSAAIADAIEEEEQEAICKNVSNGNHGKKEDDDDGDGYNRSATTNHTSKHDEQHPAFHRQPTLLIATGRGKVRAGIFSRQHLMTSGMECSTALPVVHEAMKRKMHIIMLDPNVHGERLGMSTFQQSMSKVFHKWEKQPTLENEAESEQQEHKTSQGPSFEARDLFVLSHSQSGAQLARYLLEKSEHYLPHIRAIAFTDSTHNIQWTRQNENLHHLLQSDRCVYYKSAKVRDSDLSNSSGGEDTAGNDVDTDEFWKHRFGSIATKCAGTSEHSLTNWSARGEIWNHFDGFMKTS